MNYKVINMKKHVGGLSCGGATTIESGKHGVEMKLTPVGVVVKEKSGKLYLTPYPNITECLVEEEVAAKPEKAPKA